jgi:hypothetical protein
MSCDEQCGRSMMTLYMWEQLCGILIIILWSPPQTPEYTKDKYNVKIIK